MPGFTGIAAQDHLYGTIKGKLAVATPDGKATFLPDGTLIPTDSGGKFLHVVSQSKLYPLNPGND